MAEEYIRQFRDGGLLHVPSRPTAFRGIIEVVVRDYMRHESNEDNGKGENGGTEARSRVELSRLYQLAKNGTYGIRAAGPGSDRDCVE